MNVELLLRKLEIISESPGGLDRMRTLVADLATSGALIVDDNGPADDYVGTKDDELDERLPQLPESWDWVSLASAGRLLSGDSASSEVKEELFRNRIGVPYIATKDVGYGREPLNYDNGLVVAEGDTRFKRANSGAVLLCMEGGSAGKKMGLSDREICFGNKLLAVETHEHLLPGYLMCVYQSTRFQEQFRERVTGIIGGISKKALSELLVPIPPRAEQEVILAKVDELMTLCDMIEDRQRTREILVMASRSSSLNAVQEAESSEEIAMAWGRVNSNWETFAGDLLGVAELRRVGLYLAVHGKLLEGNNDQWTICTLGDQLTLQRGFDITKKEQNPGPYPVVSSGGVLSTHDAFKCSGPGVVLGRKGSVGKVHWVEDDYWPHDTTLYVKDFKGNLPEFVYYFLLSFPLMDFESSTANPSLNRNRLHPVPVRWPLPEVQVAIVDAVKKMTGCCDDLATSIDLKDQIARDLATVVTAF